MKQFLQETRTSYYVGGKDSDRVAKKLARRLVDPEHQMKDEDIFFVAGSQGGILIGYAGQPVIIWPKPVGRSVAAMTGHIQNFYDLFEPYVVSHDWNEPDAVHTLTYRYNIVYGLEVPGDAVEELRKDEVPDDEFGRRLKFYISLADRKALVMAPPTLFETDEVEFLMKFVEDFNRQSSGNNKRKKKRK